MCDIGRQWFLGDELFKILSDRESRNLEHDSGSRKRSGKKWLETGGREDNQVAVGGLEVSVSPTFPCHKKIS